MFSQNVSKKDSWSLGALGANKSSKGETVDAASNHCSQCRIENSTKERGFRPYGCCVKLP